MKSGPATLGGSHGALLSLLPPICSIHSSQSRGCPLLGKEGKLTRPPTSVDTVQLALLMNCQSITNLIFNGHSCC